MLTPEAETVLRLALAAFLGYIIGLERELSGLPAGDRTHAVVSLGSAAFTIASITAFPGGDPTRLAASVVTGLGFLGAGMILKEPGNIIHGLTTAAGIWAVGAVGVAIGSGLYLLGISTTVLIFIILTSERVLKLDERLTRRREAQNRGKE